MSRLFGAVLGVSLLAMSGCAGMGPSSEARPVLVLSPTTENGLDVLVRDWAERWTAATGVAIVVAPGGAPVTFEDDLPSAGKPGEQDCGVTQAKTLDGMWFSTDFVKIHRSSPRGCPGWGYTLGHELGHALSACAHVSDADDALMSPRISRAPHRIDEESLVMVCGMVDCTEFSPETGAP